MSKKLNDKTFGNLVMSAVYGDDSARDAVLRGMLSSSITEREHLIQQHLYVLNQQKRIGDKVKVEGRVKMTSEKPPNTHLPTVDLIPENMISVDFISAQGINKVHEGKFLLCRTIMPPVVAIGQNLLVDDPEGDVVRVGVYNMTKKINAGTYLAVMQPYYKKTATDDFNTLRCENPTHIYFLEPDHPLLQGVVWKENYPKESGLSVFISAPIPISESENLPERKKTVSELTVMALRSYKDKDYGQALQLYSRALQLTPDDPVLYSNRALTHLTMQNPAKALYDAEAGLRLDGSNLTLITRKAKALLWLKRFNEAERFLEHVTTQHWEETSDKKIVSYYTIAKQMHRENGTGQYDFLQMWKEAKKSAYLENHADYFDAQAFELRAADGVKNRGLFATADLEPGTLLFACKAFVYSHSDEAVLAPVFQENYLETAGFTALVEKMCEKLTSSPECGYDFYKLYAGEKLGFSDTEEEYDPKNPLQMERLQQILRMNAFQAQSGLCKKEPLNFGLWILPSYMNHSCVDSNCFNYCLGDFMFVRARRRISKDEELLISYVPPSRSQESRRLVLEHHFGFVCKCRLCEVENVETAEVKKQMEITHKILMEMEDEFEKNARKFGDKEKERMKKMLRDVVVWREDENLNFLACSLRVNLAKGGEKDAEKLLEKNMEIYENCADTYQALVNATVGAKVFKGKTGRKWMTKSVELAKILWGGEEVLEVMEF